MYDKKRYLRRGSNPEDASFTVDKRGVTVAPVKGFGVLPPTPFGVFGQTRHVSNGMWHVRLVERSREQCLRDALWPGRIHGNIFASMRGPLPRHRGPVQPVVRLRVSGVHHGHQPMFSTVAGPVTIEQRAVRQPVHVRWLHVYSCGMTQNVNK